MMAGMRTFFTYEVRRRHQIATAKQITKPLTIKLRSVGTRPTEGVLSVSFWQRTLQLDMFLIKMSVYNSSCIVTLFVNVSTILP